MATQAHSTTTRARLVKGILRVKAVLEMIETFLKKASRLMQQATGIIICLGGVCATVGWLMASLHPDPLGPTWNLSIWLVVIGVFALLLGILALATRHLLRIGTIGLYSVLIFLVGALVLMAGAFAVNLFILPWIAKLFAQFPDLGSILQGGYNAVQHGINSTTSTITNTGSSICNTIASPFGGGGSCSTPANTAVVPSQQVPSLSVDDVLKQIGLPSIATLGTLGLVFLSGAPLAPGCLLVGIVFLFAGVRPRSSLLLLIIAALLNLGGQFVLHLAFLGPFLGVLLYLALAWFGFTLWSPWKFSLLEKLLPLAASSEPAETVEPAGQ
ncbi:MAG TPA: hypothetical protein VGF67_18660 [Ktedonobacteraceae bacterium]|jgi:hypothetical protein